MCKTLIYILENKYFNKYYKYKHFKLEREVMNNKHLLIVFFVLCLTNDVQTEEGMSARKYKAHNNSHCLHGQQSRQQSSAVEEITQCTF